MTEPLLAILLSVLVCCGILATIALRFGWRLLPRSAFEGFASAGAPFSHFQAAVRLMCTQKWLLLLPLALVLTSFILRELPRWWAVRSAFPPPPPRPDWDPSPFESYLAEAVSAASFLWRGYLGSLHWDVVPLTLAIVLFLIMLKRLEGATAEGNARGLNRVAMACWGALVCLLAIGLDFLCAGQDRSFHERPLPTWVALEAILLELVGTMLNFCLVFPLALLECWFLVHIRASLRGEETCRRAVWNQALSVLAPIVRLVLVAFLLLSLPRAVWSLSGKVGWLSEVWQVFHYRAAPIIGDWLYYQEVLLSVAFFLSPFLVVVNGRPAGSALLANLAFVRQRFLKWAIMLGLAIACLAGAGLLRLVVARYFWLPRAQWWELIPPAIARMAQVTVQAICAIALFDFFLQHGATDAAAPRAAEPTPAPA